MSEHPCHGCGTPSRLDERFCARCGLLFPALAPLEPVTQPIPVPPPPDRLRVRPVPTPRPDRTEARPGRRGPLTRMAVAVAVITGAVLAVSLSAGRTTEQQVRSVFERQVAAIRSGQLGEAHARFAPDVRRACPVDAWVAGFGPFFEAGGDLSLLDYADVEVRVAGDEASLTYALLYDGRVVREVAEPDPDRYVRIDGRWYDAADPSTACGTAVDAVRPAA